MKILVITSRYPPYHFGGYEIRGKNIVDELSSRGHEILVITSIKETASSSSPQAAKYQILRRLHLKLKAGSFIDRLTQRRGSYFFGMLLVFARELLFDLQDMGFIDSQMDQFKPDVIYLGHIIILSKALLPYLAACRIPIVYDEGGLGLIDSWKEKGIWYKFVEEYDSRFSIINTLKPLMVKFVGKISGGRLKPHWVWPSGMRLFFNSELNRQNTVAGGVPISGAKVIHSGIDTRKFAFRAKTKLGSPLVFIVPGRIEPRKGQMDGVRLLSKLGECGLDAKMVFVGENWVNSYYLEVESEIKTHCLEEKMVIKSMIEHDKLMDLYYQADICFFPSYFKTGFSRIPLEAMACGCIIISYGNEGSDEIIQNGKNGFLVAEGDFQRITAIIKQLISNPVMVRNVINDARREIEETYSMQKYVDQIEEIVANAAAERLS